METGTPVYKFRFILQRLSPPFHVMNVSPGILDILFALVNKYRLMHLVSFMTNYTGVILPTAPSKTTSIL